MATLYHHGALGQKWGIHRFQNKNGTLTSAGKKRYNSDKSKSDDETSEKKGLSDKQKRAIKIGADVIGGGTTLVKVVGRRINLKKQQAVKELYCYDRSLGHYWRLKRELSNAEWVAIDKRKEKRRTFG